jgi:hypothetical protein
VVTGYGHAHLLANLCHGRPRVALVDDRPVCALCALADLRAMSE